MSKEKQSSHIFWKTVVVVLLVVVCTQLYLQRNPSDNQAVEPQDQPQVNNQNEQLVPKPLLTPPNRYAVQPPHRAITTRPRGVNPYDQPQLKSRMDMFRQMQQAAQQMMRQMDNNMPSSMFRGMHPGGRALQSSSPVMEADGSNYIVKMEMPGLDKSNVSARISGSVLTISGTQKQENKTSRHTGSYYASSSSQFQTSMTLPGPVKSDQMKVDYTGRTLTVTIPKA